MLKNRLLSRFILLLLPVMDRLLRMTYHIKPLRADGSGVIGVELRRYKGYSVILDNGSEIKDGDTIIELHMNSAWFKERRKLNLKASDLPWEVLHCFAQDLNFLAEQIVNGMFHGVTALHGKTFLHIGARRLGFQVEELPDTLWKKWAQFYLAGIMQIHHLGGDERFEALSKPLELKEFWLSKTALLQRYSPKCP